MTFRKVLPFVTVSLGMLAGVWCRADDQALDIARLISDLDSPKFAVRRTAAQELQRLGTSAFPALGRAARSQAREASMRAIEILRRHFEEGDNTTQEAARAALEQIGQDGPQPAAHLAREALAPPTSPPSNRPPGPQRGVQVLPAPVQIQVQAIANNRQRVTIKSINGNREITVEEPQRSIKIQESANGRIQVEVTETKGGRKQSQKVSARNIAELKKQHPQAYKLYQQYQRGGANIQIQIQALPGQLPALLPRLLPGQPGVPKLPHAR